MNEKKFVSRYWRILTTTNGWPRNGNGSLTHAMGFRERHVPEQLNAAAESETTIALRRECSEVWRSSGEF